MVFILSRGIELAYYLCPRYIINSEICFIGKMVVSTMWCDARPAIICARARARPTILHYSHYWLRLAARQLDAAIGVIISLCNFPPLWNPVLQIHSAGNSIREKEVMSFKLHATLLQPVFLACGSLQTESTKILMQKMIRKGDNPTGGWLLVFK